MVSEQLLRSLVSAKGWTSASSTSKYLAASIKRNLFYPHIRAYSSSSESYLLLPKPVTLAYTKTDPEPAPVDGRGEVEPIIIAHGLFGTRLNWKSLSGAIARGSGRSVYAVDLRNHGESPHTSGEDATYPGMASDLNLFLDMTGHKKTVLIGHSMGGRAVFQFSFLFPERVERLVAVDISPTSFPSHVSSMSLYVESMKEALLKTSRSLSLSEARKLVDVHLSSTVKDKFIRNFLLMNLIKDKEGSIQWKYNLVAIGEMLRSGNINRLEAKRPFPGKALFIYGGQSDYVRREDEDGIRELYPKAQFHCIPDVGHYLHIERQATFLETLIPFLDS